jgi:alanyl-tRNA synthetase
MPAALQQLEKQLSQARQEVEALRQRQERAALAARNHPQQQQQQPPPDARTAREQQLQVQELRAQMLAAQQQHKAAEEQLLSQLRGKGAALAASDKRLRQFEGIMRRLAAKQGGGSRASGADSFLLGTSCV